MILIYGYTKSDYCSMIYCTNRGEVTGSNYMGGIVGRFCIGKVDGCINSGNISGGIYVGGIINEEG